MRLRGPQVSVPATSVTDSATVILGRIVSTRPTRRTASSPQRSPQYHTTRMMARRCAANCSCPSSTAERESVAARAAHDQRVEHWFRLDRRAYDSMDIDSCAG